MREIAQNDLRASMFAAERHRLRAIMLSGNGECHETKRKRHNELVALEIEADRARMTGLMNIRARLEAERKARSAAR